MTPLAQPRASGTGQLRSSDHHTPATADGRTIAIVDDHLLLVETITAALASTGITGFGVPVRPRARLLEQLLLRAPDLVLLDLDLGPYGDATPIIAPLTAAGIRVLVVTGLADRIRQALVLEQGAIGVQSKADGFEALLRSAREALQAAGPLRPAEAAALRVELAAHRQRASARLRSFDSLTEREQATLEQLAEGHTASEIGRAWVVSEATVRSHVQAVLRKLGVRSQLQAVAAARRTGWLDRAREEPAPQDAAERAG